MQNPIQTEISTKLYSFRETRFLSERLKTFTSSNYHRVQYFLLKRRTHFLLTNVCKRVFDLFFFCLDLELLAKIKKDLVSTNSIFTFLLITQDLNEIKKIKNPEHPFLDIVRNVCKILAKNIKLLWQFELVKVFNFSDKQPGFLEIIELCLYLGTDFCIT